MEKNYTHRPVTSKIMLSYLERSRNYIFQWGFRSFIIKAFEYTIIHWVALIISLIIKYVPVRSGLVILGASKGQRYDDNSRDLYEWILKNKKAVDPLWVTRDRSIVQQLEKEGRPVAWIYSPKGLYALLRAEVGVFTNSLEDLAFHPSAVPSTMSLIALRHGTSLKKVRFALNEKPPRKHQRERDLTDRAIATSEFMADLQEECLQIGREKHAITGYPRNDKLLDVPDTAQQQWEEFLDGADPSTVLLYAPTWRHGRGPTEFFPFRDFDAKALIEWLGERDALLLIRPHPKDFEMYTDNQGGWTNEKLQEILVSNRVRLASHREFTDTNSLLPFVDLLITDYSSICYDFMLLDRPMLFVPYDYTQFKQYPGFLCDYYEYTPGPTVESLSGFLETADESLVTDAYQDRREELFSTFHKYCDARSRERTAELVFNQVSVDRKSLRSG